MRAAINLRNANLMVTDGHGESMRSLARALVETADSRRLDLLMDAPSRYPGFEGANARVCVLRPFGFGNRLLTQAFGGDPWYRARVPLARAWRAADVYFQSAHEPPPFVSGPPHVAMVHDVAFMRPGAEAFFDAPTRDYLDRWTASSIHRADRVLAVSEWVRDEVTRIYGFPAERVDVAPHGVDGDRFRADVDAEYVTQTVNRLGIQSPYVLFLGTLQPRKNLGTLARAYVEARRRGLAHTLVLAGVPGWRYADVAADLERMSGEGIQITGAVEAHDLPALLAGASAFVSVAIDEGFGMPVLEAMASGVPVVATNQGGLANAAGDAGMAVDPHDSDAIAEALLQVTSDERLREDLRSRGLARAAEFTWTRTARRAWKSLEQACASS